MNLKRWTFHVEDHKKTTQLCEGRGGGFVEPWERLSFCSLDLNTPTFGPVLRSGCIQSLSDGKAATLASTQAVDHVLSVHWLGCYLVSNFSGRQKERERKYKSFQSMASSNQSGFLAQAEPPVELPFINGAERKRSEGVMCLMRLALARQHVSRHVSRNRRTKRSTRVLGGQRCDFHVTVCKHVGGAMVTSPTGFHPIPPRKPWGGLRLFALVMCPQHPPCKQCCFKTLA